MPVTTCIDLSCLIYIYIYIPWFRRKKKGLFVCLFVYVYSLPKGLCVN